MQTDIYVELEFDRNHFLEIKASTDYKFVNDGIGAYEFWGQKGYDSRMINELQDYEVFDAKNNNITAKLSKHHVRVIEAKIETDLESLDEDYN